ncbi:MAG: insulinase family protein, partial [Sciscionella sp.]|nr:insulinase family protein [Sciscionella sp.]
MECDATEHTLDNGLRVVLAEDRLAPIASVCLWYDVGSRHEKSGRTGLAHLFEHLMFQGSRNVPGNGHFELVQGAGGTLNGTTSFERTNYFETVPVNQLELMLWAEADRMGSLLDVLDQSSVDNQRDVVKNERRQRYDNVPYGTALERLVQNVFPAGHPYQHMPIGSMADLDAASLDDAREFFRTFYAPNNAVLSVVGDIDSRRVLNWVDRYFGSIESQPNSVPKKDGAIGPVIGEEIVEIVREDVPNPALFAGYRLPADGTAEADAAELATIIAGRGHASLLHNRLVRRDRSASSVELSMIRLAGTESIGVLEVMVTPGADLDAVRTAVDDELA